MDSFNFSRRKFLDRNFKIGLGVALSSLVDIPFVMKRALAEGTIGLNGKKLLFIFLRGANDALNSVIPVGDDAYNLANRPNLMIPPDAINYTTAGPCDFPQSSANPGDPSYNTFSYNHAIRLGNGFSALHPSLKFLAPVYNAGHLAMVHRVGYPNQSRSHFDSQNYWENGTPNNDVVKDGIFYRAMIESGMAATSPLTGVSVQSALPLILRGNAAAMTNLTDPTRYNLLGIPNNTAGNLKADRLIATANTSPYADKKNRALLDLQYHNLSNTLSIFANIDFSETGNTFTDNVNTDGDAPYYLFPTSGAKNGGAPFHGGDSNKYVVDNGAYGFFVNLKAAALTLNRTDAIIAGSEMGGFDTHNSQGGATGLHANLMRRLAWSIYGLQKYFQKYGKGGTAADPNAKVGWNDLVIVTLSEFGRTTIENGSGGTDHAEAGLMFVAGGGIHSGAFACHPNDIYNGQALPWVTGQTGSMFGASGRYLQRVADYRSVLGELIRDHLGATPAQLNRIIPGYAIPGEKLQAGGVSSLDGTTIAGELGLV